MKINRVMVDRKPNNCMICPLIKLRVCGESRKVQTSSGAMYYESVPDGRCLLREGK